MRNSKKFTNSLLGLLLVFALMLFTNSSNAQCPQYCGTTTTYTFDHNNNGGAACGNSAFGDASIAAGLNSTSSAFSSFTFGEDCIIDDGSPHSLAGGFNSVIHSGAEHSFVYGSQCQSFANGAFAGGIQSTSNAPYSWSFGNTCITSANADYSFALGDQSSTDAIHAFAGGRLSEANAPYSLAYGLECRTLSNTDHSYAFGNNSEVTDGVHNYALGDNVTVVNDDGYSLAFGRDITHDHIESVLFGWDSPTFFAENDSGVGIFTDDLNTHFDLHIEGGGDILQNYSGTYPNEANTNNHWSIDGDAPRSMGLLPEGFGKRYQDEEYFSAFGIFQRFADANQPYHKDGAIIFGDDSAAADERNTNWFRFFWESRNGFRELMRLMPNPDPLTQENLLEVYGQAGKPGGGMWNGISDRRLKSDINPFSDGLEELMQLKPVRYHYNDQSGLSTKPQYVGLIAQDVNEVAPYMVGKSERTGYYTLDATPVIYMLVNSVKEQHELYEEEKEKRENLEDRVDELEEKFDAVFGNEDESSDETSKSGGHQKEVTLSNTSIDEALLYQNIPNPFTGSTEIGYYLPESTNEAMIIIAEAETGQVLKRVALNEAGSGKLRVNVEGLSAGTYTYTLVIDGKKALTRQMVLN